MTCVRHGGNKGSIFCRFCDVETIEREEAMTPQERLRFELCRIADEECYDFGSHQLMMLRQDEARELRSYLDAQEARIKRLEEALRFYATREHYYEACIPLQNDGGSRARKALKSSVTITVEDE